MAEKTILLAEDEAAVRSYVRTVLVKTGFNVLEASSAPEALQLARETPGAIDLLLTDVRMPGMNGLELANQIRKEMPDVKIVIMSGQTSGYIESLAAQRNFISKPFLPQALTKKIEDALAGNMTGPEEV